MQQEATTSEELERQDDDALVHAQSWMTSLGAIGEALASVDVSSSLSAAMAKLTQGRSFWFYLVDEKTMQPVQDSSGLYPIEITTPAEFVPKVGW